MGTKSSNNDLPSFDSLSTNEEEDYSIGNHSVTSSPKQEQSKVAEAKSSAQEIPAWLKGDTQENAKPVGVNTSSSSSYNNSSSDKANDPAKVHDNFGLTPVDAEE